MFFFTNATQRINNFFSELKRPGWNILKPVCVGIAACMGVSNMIFYMEGAFTTSSRLNDDITNPEDWDDTKVFGNILIFALAVHTLVILMQSNAQQWLKLISSNDPNQKVLKNVMMSVVTAVYKSLGAFPSSLAFMSNRMGLNSIASGVFSGTLTAGNAIGQIGQQAFRAEKELIDIVSNNKQLFAKIISVISAAYNNAAYTNAIIKCATDLNLLQHGFVDNLKNITEDCEGIDSCRRGWEIGAFVMFFVALGIFAAYPVFKSTHSQWLCLFADGGLNRARPKKILNAMITSCFKTYATATAPYDLLTKQLELGKTIALIIDGIMMTGSLIGQSPNYLYDSKENNRQSIAESMRTEIYEDPQQQPLIINQESLNQETLGGLTS